MTLNVHKCFCNEESNHGENNPFFCDKLKRLG